MKNFKNLFMCVAAIVGLATIAGLAGIVPEGGFLADLINFFSFGHAGLAIAVAAAVTETTTTNPEGTTVVSGIPDGESPEGVESPDYLDDDLNRQIVLVRPQDFPIDTLTRNINNVERSESWEAGGWEMGVREIVDKLAVAISAHATSVTPTAIDMWLVGDTFTLVGDNGPILDGGSPSLPISCLVTEVGASTLTVKRIAANLSGDMPAVPITDPVSGDAVNVWMIRQSRAVSELEASITGFAPAPTSRKVFNQTHMTQVEESVIHSLLKKKVAMDFSVYKEQTLWDFKRGMELANLFQYGGMAKNAKGEVVHLSTGLWWQAEKSKGIDYSAAMSDQDWNGVGKFIFDGNNGSDRRLLLAGPDLIAQIANAKSYSKQLEAQNTEIVSGLRVNRIETPFGELLVKPLGSIMPKWFSKCGLVLDLNFVKKYVMEPLRTDNLNLNLTGQRRVDNAVRMLETYSLFLENLPVHCKIVPAQ